MSKKLTTTIFTYLILAIIVFAGYYLLDFEKHSLNWWAFGSLMFSLFFTLTIRILVIIRRDNKEKTFYTSGMNSLAFIYQLVVIISIFFTGFFEGNVNKFIFMELVINLLFLIGLIVVDRASGRVVDNNNLIKEKLENGEFNAPKRGDF